jgi:hypothetical protein
MKRTKKSQTTYKNSIMFYVGLVRIDASPRNLNAHLYVTRIFQLFNA